MAKSAELTFSVNGKNINAPIEWTDIEILASFEDEAVQANISTDSFTFVNEARQEILNHIQGGLGGGIGIFEGVPFKIQASNTGNSTSVFDGFVNLTEGFADFVEAGRLEAGIAKADGLNNLNEKVSALTIGYLLDQGFITESDYVDIPYVVVQPTSFLEVATLGITSFLLAKELAENIKGISKNVAEIAAHLAGGVSGITAATGYLIAVAIIDIAYAVAIIAALSKILVNIINTLMPIKRTHKAIKLKRMLEAIASYSGYELETDIAELEQLVYLPSNPNVDTENSEGFLNVAGSITQGIPNSSDYGYRAIEVIQLAKDLFNAKFAVSDNGTKLQFRGLNSDYWQRAASYTLPDVLQEQVRYNTDELNANVLLSFDTDISDNWTIAEYTGTAYEIITDAVITSNEKAKTLKGLGETRFNVCLGNRKSNLTALESILFGYAVAADALINVFATIAGKPKSNLAATVKGKTNLLKVSNNNHSKPKLLYVDDSGVILSNARELFSAKALFENYHIFNSFVSNNWNGQKKVFEGVRVPFGLDDYLKLIENSYIATKDGSQAKVTALRWRLGSDFASLDYYIREPYTTNLTETFIEP